MAGKGSCGKSALSNHPNWSKSSCSQCWWACGVWMMLWRRAPPHSTTLGSAAGHAKSRDMLAGKMLLQRLLQLGFSLLFLMAPSCDSRLLPLPGARGCSAGSAAAAGCGWGEQGLRSGTAALGGDPTHP